MSTATAKKAGDERFFAANKMVDIGKLGFGQSLKSKVLTGLEFEIGELFSLN